MRNGISIIAACALVLLNGCSDSEADIYQEQAYVFGTIVSFTVVGVSEETARRAVKKVGQELQVMHKEWHAWEEGELTALNAALAKGESFEASDLLLPMLKQAQELSSLSDDLFNPAIGALVGLWGFHSDDLPIGSLPPFEEIDALVARAPSMSDVVIKHRTVSSKNKAVQFDFGGFGKGAALDRAELVLKEHGVFNAIINAGGDINTIGSPGERLWSAGIRHPVHWGAIASVELEAGENIYTSGNYERFRESDGIKYAHIIDPRNGMPVQHIVSATVIHNNGALADAAATALTIAGPNHWYGVAQKMGLRYAMLIDSEGTVYLNPAMKERLKFERDEPLHFVVSPQLFVNKETSVQG